jgi:hypothetical protein
MSRCFFALGIYYSSPTGGIFLRIMEASMKSTEIIGYNLDLAKDSENKYTISERQEQPV